jgi:NAD(P)H-flavin reductase
MDDKKENIFLPKAVNILKKQQITELEYHYTLQMADASELNFSPGQILEVSLFGYGEIPIGLASSPTRGNTFEFVIRSVGRVSAALNKLTQGDVLYIRGPLGKGFDLAKLTAQNILIVAGGIGLCPTRSLIQYILDRRQEYKSFTLFYGAKTPQQQLFLDDLKHWRESSAVDFYASVDNADPDLNKGNDYQSHIGLITDLFTLTDISADTRVVVCGPPIMYKFVIRELELLGIAHKNIFLDLERRMKCAVGKCGHCQLNDIYVCIDGPVFPFSEIEHLEEAL